jgi:hypothetical protein
VEFGQFIVAGFLNYLKFGQIKNPGASTGVFSSKPVKVTQISYDDDGALEQLLLLSYDDGALVQLLQLFYDDGALEQLLLLSYDDALEQQMPSYDGALVLLSLLLFFFF